MVALGALRIMNAFVVAIGCCMLAQPAADSDPFQPKVVPAQEAPADFGEPPPSTGGPPPAAPDNPFGGSSETPDPGLGDPSPLEPTPFDSGTPAAVTPAPAPAEGDFGPADQTGPRDSSEEEESAGDMAPLGNVPRQRLRPPEIVAQALASPREGGLSGAP